MYVNHNATSPISQMLDNHLHHRSQEICIYCNDNFDSSIHFSEKHKIYALDVTDRNVTE